MTQSGLLDRSDRYRLLIGTAAFVIIAAGIRQAAPLLNSILLAMLLVVAVAPVFDALPRAYPRRSCPAPLFSSCLWPRPVP